MLQVNELKEVKGGGFSLSVVAGLLSGVIFIIGFVDGFMRPLKCR